VGKVPPGHGRRAAAGRVQPQPGGALENDLGLIERALEPIPYDEARAREAAGPPFTRTGDQLRG
jgi:hypothetical protein